VSTGGQDLFVICKSCGSEVSPYITECPYCGSRLRKRAPKLDRDQRPAEPKPRAPRTPPPLLTRLRRDEIPGIRGDRHPHVTLVLLALGLIGALMWHTTLSLDIGVFGSPGSQWWRVLTAAFVYDRVGYGFLTLAGLTVFGWLLERRHGAGPVLVLFALGGIGGVAATTALDPSAIVLGAPGGALALACAWAVPDLLELRSGREVEGDLLGWAAFAIVLALMPLADPYAGWISVGVGAVVGFSVGVPLALMAQR
jgi:membrane associated rhomboid family serine protease